MYIFVKITEIDWHAHQGWVTCKIKVTPSKLQDSQTCELVLFRLSSDQRIPRGPELCVLLQNQKTTWKCENFGPILNIFSSYLSCSFCSTRGSWPSILVSSDKQRFACLVWTRSHFRLFSNKAGYQKKKKNAWIALGYQSVFLLTRLLSSYMSCFIFDQDCTLCLLKFMSVVLYLHGLKPGVLITLITIDLID